MGASCVTLTVRRTRLATGALLPPGPGAPGSGSLCVGNDVLTDARASAPPLRWCPHASACCLAGRGTSSKREAGPACRLLTSTATRTTTAASTRRARTTSRASSSSAPSTRFARTSGYVLRRAAARTGADLARSRVGTSSARRARSRLTWRAKCLVRSRSVHACPRYCT